MRESLSSSEATGAGTVHVTTRRPRTIARLILYAVLIGIGVGVIVLAIPGTCTKAIPQQFADGAGDAS